MHFLGLFHTGAEVYCMKEELFILKANLIAKLELLLPLTPPPLTLLPLTQPHASWQTCERGKVLLSYYLFIYFYVYYLLYEISLTRNSCRSNISEFRNVCSTVPADWLLYTGWPSTQAGVSVPHQTRGVLGSVRRPNTMPCHDVIVIIWYYFVKRIVSHVTLDFT